MNLVDKLEVWGFEKEITVFKDSSLGFGFEFLQKDVSSATDDVLNQIKNQIHTFLGSLPQNIDVQFVQIIEKENKNKLNEHLSMAKNSEGLVKSLAEARISRLDKMADFGLLPIQRNFVFFRTISSKKKITLFQNSKEIETDFKKSLEKAKLLLTDIEQNLSYADLKPKLLSPVETAELIFDTWNPNYPIPLSTIDERDIRDRVLLSDMVKEIKGFRLNSTNHRVITLKVLPEITYAGMAQSLMNLPFSSKVELSIHIPDQNKEIEWLKLNRRMAYALVNGKKGVSDLESEAKLQDVEDLLNDVVKNGEKIFSVSLSIILRSESNEELDSQVNHVLQVIRELSGSEGFVESYAAFDIFAASSIPNARCKERSKRLKSSNLADLIPLFGLWNGFSKPSILLRNQNGSLFSFDPFSPNLTNANQVISGGSGSGKSYLTNLMMGQMLAQNPKIFILDIGGSYKKICEQLNGQYIPLSLSKGITMNPFDIEGAVNDEKIIFLTTLVQIMTKEDDKKSLAKLEKSEIENAIQNIYKERKNPKISDLKENLLQSELDEVRKIGKILSLWSNKSPYGKLLDCDTNINLEKRIVCFDLKGLESHPELQAAILYTITDLVWREVQKDPTEMKFLVFDECWKLLESDAGSQFVGEVFRTFRKNYASAIAISQNMDDFANSKAATAILPNASIKWILKQSGADFKRLADVLRLNEREVFLIQNLAQKKGEYSQSYLMCEDKKSVVSIESTPLEYWLATTDPQDYILLKKEQEATNLSNYDLLKHLSEKYPQGANF
ncbi:MAG: ATP-binding protein [Oligoflexia bacterium]|nr:ATP-binding protein [Oligoflexia bacterium]